MGSARRVDPWLHRQRPALLRLIRLTESPAEALLLPALLAHGGPEAYVLGPAGDWSLDAQVSVPTAGRTYRVDFAATRRERRVAVEVDGWRHHHATDDQECYDATRDFAMRHAGWTVVRIDAWKVFRDPMGCAAEVAEQLHQADIISSFMSRHCVETQSDEEFASTVARWERDIAEGERDGFPEVAAENRARLERLKTRRANSSSVRRGL